MARQQLGPTMLAVLPPRRHTRRDTGARMAVDLRRLSGGQRWTVARGRSSPQAHHGDGRPRPRGVGALQTRTPDSGFSRQSPPRVLSQGPLPAAPPAPPPPLPGDPRPHALGLPTGDKDTSL
ncbi:hypothetical protein JEQ12_012723 [Ovis aries]|uniref:Uncharacterized protein n=1 Tax=Ovis aries TaxID=9940 RepID=A0A835ZN22_SHEEP|nr:hypothetical protein JEQ12_012723 [Ovis aries]